MRSFVAALLAAVLAFALSGCGGSEPEPAAVPTDPAAAGAVATPAESTEASPTENGKTWEPFPLGEQTPQALADAIEQKQPLVVYFFDNEQKVTNDVTAQIDTVMDDNEGLVELYSYNLGEYATVDSEGRVDVNEELLKDDAAGQAIVALASDLDVAFTPYIVVVDSQGYIIYRHAGFIDAELLERQVQRAAE